MSSDYAIQIKNLSKCYQIYDKPHQRLLQMVLGSTKKSFYREFWALKDISVTVPKGQIVGVLGKNGAGKSTLLQVICGTLSPSNGSLDIQGRVAALLELGSGFNPEFTGIENIYLNAQLLGLTKNQVDNKLEEILQFADIGDFVYQPVKTYSSGMFARLAFSVVIHVNPDILIVDEALSVGDSWFQHKSMAYMRKLMESGCTVFFVSHSIDSIRALCDQVIWLDKGQIKMQGDVTEITNMYMNDVFIEHNRIFLETNKKSSPELNTEEQIDESNASDTSIEIVSNLENTSVLKLISKTLKNSINEIVDHLNQGEEFSLEFTFEFLKPIKNVSVGILIKDQFGQELSGESYFNTHRQSINFQEKDIATFTFRSKMILRGGQSYSIALRVNQVSKWDRSDNFIIHTDELAMVFDVLTDVNDPMWFKFKMPFEVDVT